jgi:hypothetical protein
MDKMDSNHDEAAIAQEDSRDLGDGQKAFSIFLGPR